MEGMVVRRGNGYYSRAVGGGVGVVIQRRRGFVRARIRWVKEPHLDEAVEREKNLKPLLFIKDLIMSSPNQRLPLSTISSATSALNLPSSAASFLLRYPTVFLPLSSSTFSLTPSALSLHTLESSLLHSLPSLLSSAHSLSKLLMLAHPTSTPLLPFSLLHHLQYDMGLPHDYALSLLSHFPDFFSVTRTRPGLCLQLVRHRKEIALSWMQREGLTRFPMRLPKGFAVKKEVVDWMEMWQGLPYISPYENGFNLCGRGDQAEKWVVGVLHELLHLCVGKKVEKGVVVRWGRHMGLGRMPEKVFAHYPAIFYTSNKIRTQTVVLKHCYEEETLLHGHPLLAIRHRYVDLMNQSCHKMARVM